MAWTTQRRRFTNVDIEVGIDYGIDWATPKGTCYILKREGQKITVEFLGVAYGDPKGIFEFNSLQEFNKYLITFDED